MLPNTTDTPSPLGERTRNCISLIREIDRETFEARDKYADSRGLKNEKEEKRWRTVRKALWELQQLESEWINHFDSVHLLLKSELGEDHTHKMYYCHQLSCARIESLIGVTVGTYSLNTLTPLRQFRPYANKGKGTGGNKPRERGIALLQQCWQLVQQLAGTDDLNENIDQLIEAAVWRMHNENPSEVKSPRVVAANHWKKKVTENDEKLVQARGERNKLLEEVEKLRVDRQELTRQRDSLQRQLEQLVQQVNNLQDRLRVYELRRVS